MRSLSTAMTDLGLTRSSWNQALFRAGAFSLVLIVPTVTLLLFDQRVLDDEPLWLKPLKFQISMAMLCLTLMAAILVLPERWQRSRWVTAPAWAVSLTAVYELIFLAIQAARGQRSHFNSDTLFDQIGGAIMAGGASVLVGGAMLIGLVVLIGWLKKGTAALTHPLMLSVGLALVIGGFLGGYSGSFIGMNAGPFVGTYVPSDPTLPLFGWSQTIGDLRVAHFLGMHAMQILPLITLAGGVIWNTSITLVVTVLASIGWIWLTLNSLHTALAGMPGVF